MNRSKTCWSKYVFSRLLFIYAGGLPGSIGLLLRARQWQEWGFLPETVRARVFDFQSDQPRAPQADFPEIPQEVWERTSYREEELSLLNNQRDVGTVVQQLTSPDGELHWAEELYIPGLLEQYKGQEGGQVPRLAALFAALDAREHKRFARNWLDQLATDIETLRPESTEPLEILGHDVPALSLPEEKRLTIALVFGAGGATGSGLSQALALSVRHVARQLDVEIQLIGIVITGPYRRADGAEETKRALEYALLRELEDSQRWSATRYFPVAQDEILTRSGPLWDFIYRIETPNFMAHNEAAAMQNAAHLLRLLFFTRLGFEWRKNFGNDQMRLNVAELAALLE